MPKFGTTARNAGLLAVLVVATGGVAAVAISGPLTGPPPVSEKVANYTPPPLPSVAPRPSAQEALALLTKQPTAPWTLTVLGDSTGNEAGEWVQLTASDLGSRTHRPVIMHYWDANRNVYLPSQQISDGRNAPIHVWDGSAAGRSADYSLQYLATLMPSKSDLVIVNHGHNHQTPSAATAGMRSLLFAADLKHGPAAAFVTVQNPWKAPTASSTAVQAATKRTFVGGEYGVIDVMSAFTAAPNKDELLKDDIQPSPQGSRLWADTVLKALGY